MIRRGSALALLVLVLAVPAPAPAQELLLLSEAPKIRRITIDGNEHFGNRSIKKQMVSRMPAWWLKLFRTPRLFRGQLDQDVGSIQGFYRANGFLRARVTAEASPVGDGVEVKIHIDEGSPVRITETDIRGLSGTARRSLIRSLDDQPGEPLSPYKIDQDRLRLEEYLADRGRPYGRVEDNVQFWKDDAFVALLVDEGPLVRIGDVTLAGAAGIDSSGLARELTVHPGDRFSREELTRTRQRLYDTGLFNDVTPRFPDQPDTVVDVTFELRKRKQNWMGFGVGYSNLKGSFVRFSEEWGTRNVLGTGRRFSLTTHTSHAFLNADRPPFELGDGAADAALYEPWLFGTRIRGKLSGFYRYDNQVSTAQVRQTSYGSVAEVSRELKARRTNVALQFEARWVKNTIQADSAGRATICQDDPLLCQERYRTRLASLRFTYDDRDNFLNPTHGSRHDVLVQFAGGILGGDNNFQKNVVGSSFHRRAAGRSVLSTRIRIGDINPPGEVSGIEQFVPAVDRVPLEDRFFAGGASSVRGYQENTLNGLTDGKDPSGGGLVQLLANAELRFGIKGSLGGVLFVDAGNVWRDFDQVRPRHFLPTFSRSKTEVQHLRYSIGGGIRFNTPVGPVRMESAIRLSPIAGERPQDVHFAVGQTF